MVLGLNLMIKQISSKNTIFLGETLFKNIFELKNIFSKIKKFQKFSLKINIQIFRKKIEKIENFRDFSDFFEKFYIDFQ